MARIAQFAVAFVLVAKVTSANAGAGAAVEDAEKVYKDYQEAQKLDAAKARVEMNGKVMSGEVNGVNAQTQAGAQVNVTGAQAEGNLVKIQGDGKSDGTPWWAYVLGFIVAGSWIVSKFTRR
jgi:hypothetical protein